MRLAYTTTFDAHDVKQWSGTPYHMAKALQANDTHLEYIGDLKRKLPPFFKLKQTWRKYLYNQRESPRFNLTAAKYYSEQVTKQLSRLKVDAVISPLINPIAYLETQQPIILWTDALYSALLGFYPAFAAHSSTSVAQGNQITADCLSRCTLAVFSSDWAARSAIELYGISRSKVKVVPFGANIEDAPSRDEILHFIEKRSHDKIKLLFLAKSWERKGGDIALNVAKTLYQAGHAVELTIVGYTPHLPTSLPYLKCLGFISKQTDQGKAKIKQLLAESHFLILPSRADACPMVFAEANAFGLPCLTTYVGGIATAIKNNVNGMTFGLDASVHIYCDYIVNTLRDREHYEMLALSSYREFASRLNWRAATNEIKQLIKSVI